MPSDRSRRAPGRWTRGSRCGRSRSARWPTTSAPAGCRSSRAGRCSRVVSRSTTHPTALEACRGRRRLRRRAAGATRGARRRSPATGMIVPRGGSVSTICPRRPPPTRLVDQFQAGLDAPICLTWELTYACNLACVHCLSSSGRRDPRELSTAECKAVDRRAERMQVFYVNIGGGEPTVRRDFWELARLRDRPPRRREVLDQRQPHHRRGRASGWRRSDYVDVQISLDGATAEVNDAVRGPGSYATAIAAMEQPRRGRHAGLQALGRRHPPERRPARRRSRRSPTATGRSCGSRGCGRRAAAPTSGTSCTRPRRSSASCTTGCSRTARRC